MTDQIDTENRAIGAASPALFATLAPLGRRVSFPPDIPFQAAAARGKTYNGTIGQITDGAGSPLPLEPMAAAVAGLEPRDSDRFFLYSPVDGLPELRQRWREWQRRSVSPEAPSTLPLVTVGLTHGLSVVADLFGGVGRKLVVPAPFWGNYRQTFAVRTGAEILSAPAYLDGRYNCRVIPEALAGVAPGEPAVAIVNLPSNPGGYAVTDSERAELIAGLLEEADRRPLVVICDDAYAGLVYEPDVSVRSLFWDLSGAHEQLVPIKVDGATKELSFFGGRVGFITFPFDPESDVAQALESKVKCLTRSALGSPVAASQMIVLQALRDERIEERVEQVRRVLEKRYRTLRKALEEVAREAPELLRPLPFNAGCFALLELAESLDADAVRRHLLEDHDTGLVSIGSSHLRIAFCSVKRAALPELVQRVTRAAREMAVAAKG
ncbi:MAG: aminotransferase class I/II-fold pyridoxal phosphate-dependent enzyme [Acidobacteriota bacterium]|nr:aminotransferase class I/II-fold pyridoxal phosphate-dependent enzyme [Acidobacteriota bacterium]